MITCTDERVKQIQREIVRLVREHSFAPEIILVALADLAGGAAGEGRFPLGEVQGIIREAFLRPVETRGGAS